MSEGAVGQELVPTARELEPAAPRALAYANLEKPADTIRRVAELATEIDKVIKERDLAVVIKGRSHVRVEAWTLAGSLVGVFPVLQWCEPCTLPDRKNPEKVHHGFKAFVQARTLAGEVVGAAVSYCMRSESTWAPRDDYSLASMAQTRATSKALRQPLGFIVQMAGYDATPAEEMPQERGDRLGRMLKRIGALCLEIDRTQEWEDGTMWGLMNDESILNFEEPVEKLTEPDVAVVGTALARYAEEIKGDPSREFAIFAGDQLFAEGY